MMEAIDWSFKEFCSIFRALLMSSPVLKLIGSKIDRPAQSWLRVVVDLSDDLGMGRREM